MPAIKLTEERYALIPSLVERGLSTQQIAAEFGCTPNSLKVLCSKRGISLRRGAKPIPIPSAIKELHLHPDTFRPIRAKAIALGIDELALIKKLLRTIVRDDLFGAVLDI